MSFVDSLANVLVGYGVAVLPLFGVAISATESLLIGLIFMVTPIGRGYPLRRGFEALRVRQSVPSPKGNAVNSLD